MHAYLIIMTIHAVIVIILCLCLRFYFHEQLSAVRIARTVLYTIFFPLLDLYIIINILSLFIEWRTYKELKEIYHLEEEKK